MRNVRRTRRFLLLLLAVWLLFIWAHSMIPARSSAAESRWVGQLITPVLELFTGKGNVTDHLVRKLAHFCEYAALGVLSGALVLLRKDAALFHWSYALLCTLAVAVIDESIQLLATGRGAQVQDILLDTAGSLTGLLLIWGISWILRKKRPPAARVGAVHGQGQRDGSFGTQAGAFLRIRRAGRAFRRSRFAA